MTGMLAVNTPSYFTLEELSRVDRTRIPHHIAIIPDGNRRWAKKNLERIEKGHRSGANVLIETIKAAKELGVKALTFYLFSTENWNRDKEEVHALMWLLQEFLQAQCEEMQKDGIRLQTIGQIEKLPPDVLAVVEKTKQATAQGLHMDMIMALNYGSRNELCRAFHHLMDMCNRNEIQQEQITEQMIASCLDTAPWGDPDLLIRTSGEWRVSNFLLWQISYAEIYISDVMWPDFTPSELLNAVVDFQQRQRRLGGA